MHRPSAVACAALIGALASSCQVYDAELIDPRVRRGDVRAADAEVDLEPTDAATEAEAGSGAACGDGVVSPDEQCDIAIARGMQGACPDGCSGGRGCLRNELEGEGCQARCAEHGIEHAEDDDGCCPPGTDLHADSDCAPRCGNGVVERGERCDPPESCPTSAACSGEDACSIASFSGEPDDCSARCEQRRIEGCEPGDGCCPPGCMADRDTDCEPPPIVFDCASAHGTSDCQRCDCEHCGAEVAACIGAVDAEDARLCAGVIGCAETEACLPSTCYCGTTNADSCVSTPRGPCIDEVHRAARTTYPLVVFAQDGNTNYTLGRAVALLECRQQHCTQACKLPAPAPAPPR